MQYFLKNFRDTPIDKRQQIINTLTANWRRLSGSTLFHIRVVVPINSELTQKDRTYHLNSFIRILCNSRCSVGKVDNRVWFNTLFKGGCYSHSIVQNDESSQLTVVYNLACINPFDLLTSDELVSLQIRVAKIFQFANVELISKSHNNDSELFNLKILEILDAPSQIYHESVQLNCLNKYLKRWILQAIGKEPRCIGCLYKMLHYGEDHNETHTTLTQDRKEYVA